VLVEQDPALASLVSRASTGLAVEERPISQILPVMLDQVEDIEDRGMRWARRRHKAQLAVVLCRGLFRERPAFLRHVGNSPATMRRCKEPKVE
jgi:hypothetical protein